MRDWNQEKDYISVKLNKIIDWINGQEDKPKECCHDCESITVTGDNYLAKYCKKCGNRLVINKPKERWKPGEEDDYWCIDLQEDDGVYLRVRSLDTLSNLKRFFKNGYEAGDCFKTKEQAQEASKKVKDLLLSLHNG